jgi:alkaline phosphatase D
LTNIITVSGDAHRHFAGDLMQDEGDGRILASEYLATSITSGSDGIGEIDAYHRSVRGNPCLKAMTDRRGYLLCDIDRNIWRGDLKVLDSVMHPEGELSTFASFVTERGEPGLKPA